MAVKRYSLGRGLDALLGIGTLGQFPEPEQAHPVRSLPIELIQRSRFQPRLEIRAETLQELADSIRAQGIVQPIVVRPLGDSGRYEIIAGERRWRAGQMAGLQELPAIVRDVPDPVAISIALIENLQREDLNPLEQAIALARLVNEFSLTHQQVADAIGCSRATVSNLLRLLDLREDVKRMLATRDLEMGHARALLSLEGPIQTKVAHQIIAQGLSVRETERLVRRLLESPPAKPSEQSQGDPNITRLQEELAGKLGARVLIRHGSKGKGIVVIHYNSLDELDGILAHIK